MSDGGKGDKARPLSVPKETFENNWDLIFKKKEHMNIKDYQMEPKKPLSFEEWKGNIAPQYQGDKLKAYDRLHNVDYQKEFDDMLKREYAEYCDNLNGNWLLR